LIYKGGRPKKPETDKNACNPYRTRKKKVRGAKKLMAKNASKRKLIECGKKFLNRENRPEQLE